MKRKVEQNRTYEHGVKHDMNISKIKRIFKNTMETYTLTKYNRGMAMRSSVEGRESRVARGLRLHDYLCLHDVKNIRVKLSQLKNMRYPG